MNSLKRIQLIVLATSLFLLCVGVVAVYSASANKAAQMDRAGLKSSLTRAQEEVRKREDEMEKIARDRRRLPANDPDSAVAIAKLDLRKEALAAELAPLQEKETKLTADWEVKQYEYHLPSFLKRHLRFVVGGFVLLLVVSKIDYHWLSRYSLVWMGLAVLLLIACFIPALSHSSKGASRWIIVGGVRGQPSEFAKLAAIMAVAWLLARNQGDALRSPVKTLLPYVGILGGFVALIALEPDFGTAALLSGVLLVMAFVAGLPFYQIGGLGIAGAAGGVAFMLSADYRRDRLTAWWRLIRDGVESGDHVSQSLVAVGSGGINGLGLGQSVQKYSFLPEAHTDFIFAVFAEEMGFIGCAVLIFAFVLLVTCGWRIALRAADDLGRFLAAGLTLLLATSICFNLLVALGSVPPKGLTLPFISYGGTSLLANCILVGLLCNVAKYAEVIDAPRPDKARTRARIKSRR